MKRALRKARFGKLNRISVVEIAVSTDQSAARIRSTNENMPCIIKTRPRSHRRDARNVVAMISFRHTAVWS